MASNLRAWLQDRSTVSPDTYHALNRGLPKGVGWLHTLGGVVLALLAFQAITGIFMAMYYSPHPDAAYETVRFIDFELPMGRLVRGLHKYGDSALVIVLFLHLLRTYFQGAYKAPRELVWVTGVLLFTLVLGFGFTGSLLPWDQNAYNATQARTQYFSEIPVVGHVFQLLIRGGTRIGAMTITRFYAIHALLLPALLIPLLVLHVGLAWRKGPTPPNARVGEDAPPASRFLEHQLFRDALAILVVFGIVFLLAVVRPAELEFRANPTDATYHPRAEWYFLFLFQFVKDWGQIPGLGGITWLPVVVLPGIAMTFLLLAPWIDRSPERQASRRPLMTGLMVVGLLGVVGMTVRAYTQLHPNATPGNSLRGVFTAGGEKPMDPELVAAGMQAYQTAAPPCSACHAAYEDDPGPKAGPDLTGYGLKSFLREVEGHPDVERMSFYDRFAAYVRGDLRPPDSKMPNYSLESLPKERLDAIAAYLSQDPTAIEILRHKDPKAAPQFE